MAFPQNEAETIQLFRIVQNRIGWRIIESQTNAFPDAVLESDDGERLACEFEYLSKNFKKHGHPVDDSCQLIICWRDNWPKSPLPVMALEDCAKEEAEIVRRLLSGTVSIFDWIVAQQEIEQLRANLANLDKSYMKVSRNSRRLERRLDKSKVQLSTVNHELTLAKSIIEQHNRTENEKNRFIFSATVGFLIYGAALLAGMIFK